MIQQKKIISFRLYLFFITLNITSIVLNESPIKIKIKIFNPSNEKTKLRFTLVPTRTKSKISKAFHKWLYDCFTSFKSEFFEDNIIDITIIPSKAEMLT